MWVFNLGLPILNWSSWTTFQLLKFRQDGLFLIIVDTHSRSFNIIQCAMKSTRRKRGACGGTLLALLALAWFYIGRNRNSAYLRQTSSDAAIAETFCLGSISRCNSVRLDNATVCVLLHNALQSPSAPICSGGSSIPHIIHQSWKEKKLPNHFSMW